LVHHLIECGAAEPRRSGRVRNTQGDRLDGRELARRLVRREQEAGGGTDEVCRRHGISPQTFYRWKAKYCGMGISDAQKLKTLEDENWRLKKLLAESMLDVAALKDLLGKN
jgi:putative transposase